MFFALIIVAFILIGLEIFSHKKNKKNYFKKSLSRKWNFVYRWRWIFGIIFLPISIIEYPMFGTSNSIVGFPLIVAVFDEAGRDYVGVTTMPFAIINAIIWFFIIEIILYIWSRVINKNED